MARKDGKASKPKVAPKRKLVAPKVAALPPVPADAAVTAPEQRVVGRPFPPGVSGNPAGRPKGARSKLAESFIAKLAADFAEHGETAIQKVRTEEPAQYLRVVSSLVPKAFDLGDEDGEGNRIAGVALITRGAIDAIIERGRSDG